MIDNVDSGDLFVNITQLVFIIAANNPASPVTSALWFWSKAMIGAGPLVFVAPAVSIRSIISSNSPLAGVWGECRLMLGKLQVKFIIKVVQ